METVLMLFSLLAPVVLASGKHPLGPCCAKLGDTALFGRSSGTVRHSGQEILGSFRHLVRGSYCQQRKDILVQVSPAFPAPPPPPAPHKGSAILC